jgi:hypothetical protein
MLTVEAMGATELSLQHIDIFFGNETQLGAHPQLRGDVRVDESLGRGSGSNVITLVRSLDQSLIEGRCESDGDKNAGVRRYGGVKTYNYALGEVGVKEPSGAWRPNRQNRKGGARATRQV